jgi:hypothetical protein
MASGAVLLAEAMLTRLRGQVVGAEGGVAEVALPHARTAAILATFGAGQRVGGELAATGTFFQTIQAKGLPAFVTLIEARADLARTIATGNQAVGAEALPRRRTYTDLRAVLLATWATNGTISTYERMSGGSMALRSL